MLWLELPARTNITPPPTAHLALFALCIPAGGVGVPAAVPAPLSVPPPVSGLHFVQVVHAAGRLDEESSVGSAVAVTVTPHAAVVGESARRLAVEGVTVTRLSHRSSSTGSWIRRKFVKTSHVFMFY